MSSVLIIFPHLEDVVCFKINKFAVEIANPMQSQPKPAGPAQAGDAVRSMSAKQGNYQISRPWEKHIISEV